MKDKKKKREHAAANAAERQAVEATETKVNRRPTLIAIIAGCLAVLMIAAAVVILLVALNDKYVKTYENPQVRIRLTNGMELNFTIWEMDETTASSETPKYSYAARNFIYLCNLGYFNDTVLYASTETQAVSDGYVRFGGFLSDGTHRGDNENDFWDKVSREAPSGNNYGKNPFGYRLNKDNTSKSSTKDAVGLLRFSYQRTATEFQITASDSTSSTVNGEKWDFCSFGEAADVKTRDNILAIAALSAEAESRFTGHGYFKALLDDNDEIRIKSVRVNKMLREFWREFDFMTYFLNEAGTAQNGLKSGWSYTSQKKVGVA